MEDKMNPVTVVTAVSAALQQLRQLQGVLAHVNQVYQGLKHAHQSTSVLQQGLESFRFILIILVDNVEELPRDGSLTPWWDDQALTRLVVNTQGTLEHLKIILKDMEQKRSFSYDLTKYLYSQNYDRQLSHLRTQLRTQIEMIHITVVAISGRKVEKYATDLSLYMDEMRSRIDNLTQMITELRAANAANLTSLSGLDLPHYQPTDTSPKLPEALTPVQPSLQGVSMELVSLADSMLSCIKAVENNLSNRKEALTIFQALGWVGGPMSSNTELTPTHSIPASEQPSDRPVAILEGEGDMETDHDRWVFEHQHQLAKRLMDSRAYHEALVQLESLLSKRSYSFVDKSTEADIVHLSATVLLELGLPQERTAAILVRHQAVAPEMTSQMLEKVKKLADDQHYGAAVEQCRQLYGLSIPSQQIQYPEDLHICVAQCLAKMDPIGDATAALPIHHPRVDMNLCKIRSMEALKYSGDGKIHLKLLRGSLEGWSRSRDAGVAPLEDGSIEIKLQIKLSDRLLEGDPEDDEARQILQRLESESLQPNVRVDLLIVLGRLYLSDFRHWNLARTYAERAVRLRRLHPISESPIYDPMSLLHRASHLLDHAEAAVLERAIEGKPPQFITTSRALLNFQRHVMKAEDVEKAELCTFAVKFLKRNFIQPIVTNEGPHEMEPCWSCIEESIRNAGGMYFGSLSSPCLRQRCESTERWPVMEFLASSAPVPGPSSVWAATGSCASALLNIGTLLLERMQSSPVLLLNLERLLRQAILNGRTGVVRMAFDPFGQPLRSCSSQAQLDALVQPEAFFRMVPQVSYGDVTNAMDRPPRGTNVWKAINILIRRLSQDVILSLLRTTFRPQGVWEPEVVSLLLSCCNDPNATSPLVPEGSLTNDGREAHTPLFLQVLINLRFAHARPVADVKLICDIISAFLRAGVRLDAESFLGGSPRDCCNHIKKCRGDLRDIVDEVKRLIKKEVARRSGPPTIDENKDHARDKQHKQARPITTQPEPTIPRDQQAPPVSPHSVLAQSTSPVSSTGTPSPATTRKDGAKLQLLDIEQGRPFMSADLHGASLRNQPVWTPLESLRKSEFGDNAPADNVVKLNIPVFSPGGRR